MKIDKITFGKTIPTGQFGNDRPGIVEATLEPGETPEQAWSELNKRMIAWHRAEYPALYGEKPPYSEEKGDELIRRVMMPLVSSPPVIDVNAERLEIAIENAKSPDELKSIKSLNPLFPARLLDFYNKRMGELKNYDTSAG